MVAKTVVSVGCDFGFEGVAVREGLPSAIVRGDQLRSRPGGGRNAGGVGCSAMEGAIHLPDQPLAGLVSL